MKTYVLTYQNTAENPLSGYRPKSTNFEASSTKDAKTKAAKIWSGMYSANVRLRFISLTQPVKWRPENSA